MTPNVLINVPRLEVPGGVANFFLVLRRHLDANTQYFEIGRQPSETGGFSSIKRILLDFWSFHRKLSAGDFSLVHLNPSLVHKSAMRDAIFLLLSRMHSVPVIVFFHGWDNDFQAVISHRYRRLFRYILNHAAGVIVLADHFRSQLQSMEITAPIFRLSTCVDDRIFELARPVLDAPLKPIRILYLSRLDYGKGVLEAIGAFSSLQRRLPHASLTIAGDGPVRAEAQKATRLRGIPNISFVGHVEGAEKTRIFQHSDIFFFPTFFGEGMPTTVLEAMAFGLPVVTRAVGGIKDFFENGRMGYMTESRDAAELVRLLERLAESPEESRRMGEYNHHYAKEHFSASVVSRRLEGIYERLVQ